jgi:hypothetical protein
MHHVRARHREAARGPINTRRTLLAFLLLVWAPPLTSSFDVVGWYVGTNASAFPLASLAWDVYTTIVLPVGPTLSPTGEALCEPDAFHASMLAAARAHNRSLTWGGAVDVYALLTNSSLAPYRANYLRTIGAAAAACGVANVEFDYECPPTPAGRAGIVSAAEADAYTTFLVDVLAALPPGGTVSADVGVWGLDGAWGKGDSYPLALGPWVNVTKLAAHPAFSSTA